MRAVDIVAITSLVVGISLTGYAHHTAQEACRTYTKPHTDSTPTRTVSPLTGDYKRIGGVLFCYDARDILHAHGGLR